MKLEKFMTEVAKALVRGNKVLFWKYNDSVIISFDGRFAMIIPEKKNIFKNEFLTGCPISSNWNDNLLAETGMKREIDKRTAIIFKTGTGKEVYVDEKYLKYFNDFTAEFYCKSPKSAVIVSEDCGETPCGIIMPIINRA